MSCVNIQTHPEENINFHFAPLFCLVLCFTLFLIKPILHCTPSVIDFTVCFFVCLFRRVRVFIYNINLSDRLLLDEAQVLVCEQEMLRWQW